MIPFIQVICFIMVLALIGVISSNMREKKAVDTAIAMQCTYLRCELFRVLNENHPLISKFLKEDIVNQYSAEGNGALVAAIAQHKAGTSTDLIGK